MGTSSSISVATAFRRALSSVAIFAQLLLLFTPLVELRDGDTDSRAIAAGITRPDAPSMAPQHEQAQQHNATTCPACIAQSLHAQLTAPVRLPTTIVAERTPTEIRREVLPGHDPPTAHLSRAPPVVS
jgi:hypothetical protein